MQSFLSAIRFDGLRLTRLPVRNFKNRLITLCSVLFFATIFGFDVKASEALRNAHPVNGDKVFSSMPSLRWEGTDGATDYRVQIANDAAFQNILVSDRTPITRFVPTKGLPPGEYFWRVAPVTLTGIGAFSKSLAFSVTPPQREYAIPPGLDTAGIQAVLAKAAVSGSAKVVFAAGATYRVNPQGALIVLRNTSRLDIDGNGSTIIITNGRSGFADLSNCTDVTLRNFTVDYDPLPFSVGRITAVDPINASFTVAPEAGMQEFDSPLMLEYWTYGVLLDRNVPGKMKDGAPIVIPTRKEKLMRTAAGLSLTLSKPEMIRAFEVGDKWVQFARHGNESPLVRAENCQSLVVAGITNYAVPGFHYALFNCDDAKVVGCRALVRDGRWYGGNADGVHVRFTSIGPWIEGCTFEGIGDDGIALYSKGVEIIEKMGRNQMRLDTTFFSLRPGSRFLVFDPREGRLIAEDQTVTAVQPLPKTNADGKESWKIDFEPGFAPEVVSSHAQPWQNDQVFDRTLLHQEFMIRRNILKEIRRYGAIVRGAGGAIEENQILYSSDSAITIQNEPYFWRNGLSSENVVIQRNTISGCNFSASSANRGAIDIRLRRTADLEEGGQRDAPAPWRGHKKIVVRQNSITDWQQEAIHFENVADGAVIENRITENRQTLVPQNKQTALLVSNTSGVEVARNEITGLQPGTVGEDIPESTNQGITKALKPVVSGGKGPMAWAPASGVLGSLNLSDQTRGHLREGSVSLSLADGRLLSPISEKWIDPENWIVDFPNDLRVHLRFEIADGGWLRIHSEISNRGVKPAALRQVRILNGAALQGTPALTRVFAQSESMTGTTGVFPLSGGTRSHSCIGFSDAQGRNALVLGFERLADAFYSLETAADRDQVRVSAVCAREDVPIEAGGSLRLSPLLVRFGESLSRLLDDYATKVAKAMAARSGGATMTGWCSWYHYYGHESASDILANARAMADSSLKGRVRVIQIDDGWNLPQADAPRAWGDWTPGSKFPQGMKALVEELHTLGYEAGLWLAPFSADRTSLLAKQHPDWFVRSKNPTTGLLETGQGSVLGLDLTHPDVLNWLRQTFDRVFNEWGFDYVKIDFLAHGTLPGVRYDPTKTSAEAYRMGMKVIRECAGEKKFVLACGSPLGPAIGLCDGMRIGYDVGGRWYAPMNLATWPHGNCAILPAAYPTLFRQWQNGIWWQNDPDCLLTRDTSVSFEIKNFEHLKSRLKASDLRIAPEDFGLKQNEAEFWTRAVWFTGGMTLLSEVWNELSPSRRDLAAHAFKPHGKTVRMEDYYEDPTICVLKTIDAPVMIAIFNMSDHPKSVVLPKGRLRGATEFAEWLSGERWVPSGEDAQFPEIPGRSARVWIAKTP